MNCPERIATLRARAGSAANALDMWELDNTARPTTAHDIEAHNRLLVAKIEADRDLLCAEKAAFPNEPDQWTGDPYFNPGRKTKTTTQRN